MDEITLIVTGSIYAFPLAAIGVYYLWEQLLLPRLKAKRGFIKISRIMASGHFRDFWVKPKEESSHQEEEVERFNSETGLKEKSSNNATGYFFKMGKGDNAEMMSFIDSPDMVYFQGPIKRAFYDTEGNQISINKAMKVTPPVNPKMLESLAQRTWNAARATAFTDKKNLQMLIMIAVIAAIGAAFIASLSIGMLGQNAEKIDALTSQVATMRGMLDAMRPG